MLIAYISSPYNGHTLLHFQEQQQTGTCSACSKCCYKA